MHVLEVCDVCAVRRNVLDVTIDMVFSLSAIGQFIYETAEVHHWVERLFEVILNRVDPDIDIPIFFDRWILPEGDFLGLSLFPDQLPVSLAEFFVVLY